MYLSTICYWNKDCLKHLMMLESYCLFHFVFIFMTHSSRSLLNSYCCLDFYRQYSFFNEALRLLHNSFQWFWIDDSTLFRNHPFLQWKVGSSTLVTLDRIISNWNTSSMAIYYYVILVALAAGNNLWWNSISINNEKITSVFDGADSLVIF